MYCITFKKGILCNMRNNTPTLITQHAFNLYKCNASVNLIRINKESNPYQF